MQIAFDDALRVTVGDSRVEIQVKLMGMFKDKTPADGQLELPENASVATALEALDIASDSVQVLTINGNMVRDRSHTLSDGDQMTLIPPVGGG